MNRTTAAILGLLILVVLFFAVNVLAGAALRMARLDLTEDRLYTLSDGARRIAAGVDEPVRLQLFYSRSAATGDPTIQSYAQRVRELLEEFERISGGKISLELRDPEPFSETEDEAVQAGISGVPLRNGRTLYLGLLGTNSVDGREVLPFLNPGDEQFLEYEVSRLIHRLDHPSRQVIGVLSSLPLDGAPPNPMLQQPADRPWRIMTELRELFDVRMVPPDAAEIPADVDVLLIVHPKRLSERMLYAIDQFVLKRGRAVVFVDPLCEADIPPMARQDPMAAMNAPKDSNLPRLFSAWGIELQPAVVAGDLNNALEVPVQGQSGREQVPYLPYISVTRSSINEDDPVTGRLSSLNFAASGTLRPVDGAATTVTPLVTTSEESNTIDVSRVSFFPDPKTILAEFASGGTPLTLAARVSGPVESAFPDGPPASADAESEAGPPDLSGHVAQSAEPVSLIVVADVDLLTDRMWVQEQRLGNLLLGFRRFADNGDLVINALDSLTGSNELISVRARGRYARPFTYVEKIQRDADRKYLAEEQQLQERLRETEAKLNELQRARPDAGELILTPEQQAEIERFLDERAETRRQLRAVRHNLNRDIERLGTLLKFINIGAVPAAVTLLAVALGFYRVARRKSDRRTVAQT